MDFGNHTQIGSAKQPSWRPALCRDLVAGIAPMVVHV
jgi:hypothetical protein